MNRQLSQSTVSPRGTIERGTAPADMPDDELLAVALGEFPMVSGGHLSEIARRGLAVKFRRLTVTQ